MPIYEFYCPDCNTIFSFFSRGVDTRTRPNCPRCKTRPLARQMSTFAIAGRAKEDADGDDLPFDEAKMGQAMQMLAGQAEGMDEDDPRQAAGLMRKLTEMTGMKLGHGMEEALSRMEKGDDPEQIESELGELMESEEPFALPARKGGAALAGRAAPLRDDTLYDL